METPTPTPEGASSPAKPRPRSSGLGWRMALAAGSLLFVVLVLEVGIRTVDSLRGDGFFSNHRNRVAKGVKAPLPFRIFGYDMYPSGDGTRIADCYGETYSLEKPDGVFRIVVFGGSTTENHRAFEEAGVHYPMLLQSALARELGSDAVEVINVAFSAYTTAHSLILFELDVLSWQPDMVILSHNVNDLTTAYWPEFSFDYSSKYSHPYFLPDPRPVYTTANAVFQHSRLYWVVRGRLQSLLTQGVALQRESMGAAPPARSLEVFERNLESFIALARSRDIKVVLGSQALEPSEEFFLSHQLHKSYNEQAIYPLHDEFVSHHKAYNRALRRVAERHGTVFVDNEAVLSGKTELFIDHVHMTAVGVEKLANSYAETLLTSGAIDERATNHPKGAASNVACPCFGEHRRSL